MEKGVIEGENPVHDSASSALWFALEESGCLGVQPKLGGKFHLKLNICERPIANKYCEGKMKRTLKRESKVPEIVKREAIAISMTAVTVLLRAPGSMWRTAQAFFILSKGDLGVYRVRRMSASVLSAG